MNENTGQRGESMQEGGKENILPGEFSSPIDITQGVNITDSSTKQTTKEMEVHHHGHVHEKTKWKEYFFQFFMLFLAVYLGFLAESVREHGVERTREKDYIESLVVDIDNDYALSNNLNAAIFEQVKQIDTLQTLFFSDLKNNLNAVKKCYELTSSIRLFYSEFFNERTISQLLSSGNMRLIKKPDVADSIMQYHSFIKFVEVQKQVYVNSINTCLQSMYDVYDISFLRSIQDSNGTLVYPEIDSSQIRLRTTDPAELKKFIAILEDAKLVASNYKTMLGEMNEKANRLYLFLVNEYGIKKNKE